jgi:hypothetical protein
MKKTKRKTKLKPKDTCGCNVESGSWTSSNEMLSLLLVLSYVFGQVHFNVFVDGNLTFPLCIMLLILLLKGTKERPAVDLQGIFSSMPTNKLTTYNIALINTIFKQLVPVNTQHSGELGE